MLSKIMRVLVMCSVWAVWWLSLRFTPCLQKVFRFMILLCLYICLTDMPLMGSGQHNCNICNNFPLDVNIVSFHFLSVFQVLSRLTINIRVSHYMLQLSNNGGPLASSYLVMYTVVPFKLLETCNLWWKNKASRCHKCPH